MTIQEITWEIQYIDVFINATELMMENDLQRTLDTNIVSCLKIHQSPELTFDSTPQKIYLNAMMLVFDVMDKTRGGSGGVFVNVLSSLCLDNVELKKCKYNDQQYLINKQVLMSLTEAFSQEEFFEQTGVSVLTLMPVISKCLVERNSEWITLIGLEKLVKDIDSVSETSFFEDEEDNFCAKNIFELEIHNFHQDNTNVKDIYSDKDYYYQDYDLEFEERSRSSDTNIQRVFNKLCYHMVRGIEKGHNGSKTVVGLEGIKDIDREEVLSRL